MFTPFARYRNFSLINLKDILAIYPDMVKQVSVAEAVNDIETRFKGYKKTAYQHACQLGLEDRSNPKIFNFQSYLNAFEDEYLEKYLEFWFKLYYAPNPYVASEEKPFNIFCEFAKECLCSEGMKADFDIFFDTRIGGKSKDILFNAMENFGWPLERIEGFSIFVVKPENVDILKELINKIEQDYPIIIPVDKNEHRKIFFDRFSYKNFRRFFGLADVLTEVRDTTPLPPSPFPPNRIIFGAPGTGKSYKLQKEQAELLGSNGYLERVTFHPEYTYASFVGTYKPVSKEVEDSETGDKRNEITYEYVPGPFMRTYANALKNKDKYHLLLIEEINRANVAAVFGDVFQLLDRDENGCSQYAIRATEDMKKYLATTLCDTSSDGDSSDVNPEAYSTLAIPANMFIWATMNSADQGVYPMDTAFKRRWDFEYISIDENEDQLPVKEFTVGSGANTQVINWNDLRKAINGFLVNNSINEDKLMGPFFIAKRVLEQGDNEAFKRVFKNKVLMYLFEDAARQKRSTIFAGCWNDYKTYSGICRAFEEKGVMIFNESISNKFLNQRVEEQE